MVRLSKALLVLLSFGLIAGCSSSTKIESNLGIKGAPDWVNEGTQAVDDKKGRYIYGVGSAPSMNDDALQTSTADSRARAEVAKVISSYVDSALSDYLSSSGDAASMSIEQTVKNTTQSVLNGSKIKGRWRDKNTGTIWSFAEIDMQALDDAIGAADKLSQDFKEYYSTNSDTNFDRFVKEEQE